MPSSAADLFNSGLNLLTEHKQHQHDLHGWFLFQEIKMNRSLEMRREGLDPDAPEHAGELLCRCGGKPPADPSGRQRFWRVRRTTHFPPATH